MRALCRAQCAQFFCSTIDKASPAPRGGVIVMTANQARGRHDLIETAMNRAETATDMTGDRPPDANAIWRAEQTRAMKVRQEQLEAIRAEEQRKRMVRSVVPLGVVLGRGSTLTRSVTLWAVLLMVLGAAAWRGLTRSPESAAPARQHAGVLQPPPVTQESVSTPVVDAPVAQPVEDRDVLVRDVVERWRAAWTQRDVEVYLASYGPTFVPPKGQTRAQWAASRREKLSNPASIDVAVKEVRTEAVGDQRMAVYFLQDYTSPSYREKDELKTLVLDHIAGQWQIASEWSGVFRAVSDLKK